jgi:hypothetical protein
MPKNNDPMQPWNNPMEKDNPFAPHNGYDKDNPFKPWNNPFGSKRDLTEEEKRKYGIKS